MELLRQQYQLIKQRRETLFSYCETLSQKDFMADHKSFGGRSIQFLFVHIADVYVSWIGRFANREATAFAEPEACRTVTEIRLLFAKNDLMVDKFLDTFATRSEKPITNNISGSEDEVTLTPLQLFTHVITHEFHHKGQILSMSRQLGYLPIDTDIIRFDK